jgi:heme exporter protein C
MDAMPKWGLGLFAAGLVCLGVGTAMGLFVVPSDRYMGDVQRIMYIHVPTAWSAMVAFLAAFICAVIFLLNRKWIWDDRLAAWTEVGVLLTALLCCQGALWGKKTWGVWWAWDPRLTTVAVMMLSFIGILALRRFVDDPAPRAAWSAVATLLASATLPLVWYSVKWWNSLHQLQSSPDTVSTTMHLPLRLNAFAVLFLMITAVMVRRRIAGSRRQDELAPPLPAADGGAS